MRKTVTVRGPADLEELARLCAEVRHGWRVEFKEAKRSDEQNDRMWTILADIAAQGSINGQRFGPDQWKVIFMKAMGKEPQFLPTLDGATFFPTGFRSSDLSVREMGDLMTFMEAWAAERGMHLKVWGPRETA